LPKIARSLAFDAVDPNENVNDCPSSAPFRESHGTAVSSIVAAASNDGIEVAGVCPKCKLIPVRVIGDRLRAGQRHERRRQRRVRREPLRHRGFGFDQRRRLGARFEFSARPSPSRAVAGIAGATRPSASTRAQWRSWSSSRCGADAGDILGSMRAILLVAAFVINAGCAGRANPRLTRVVEILDRDTLATAIAYDDAGHPATMTQRVTGSATTETHAAELTFSGSKLTSWTVDAASETFAYDADRLVAMHAEHDGTKSDVAISYDSDGLIESATQTDVDSAGVDQSTATTTLSYGVRGLASVSVQQQVPGQDTTEAITTLAYHDDRVTSFSRSLRSDDTVTAHYDGEKLAVLESALPGFPETFRYDDDGNIAEIDGQDVKVTFAYDAGDVADFDVNPVRALVPTAVVDGHLALPLSFWTLDGASSPTPDATTQVAHLFSALGPRW
jgi:hypothetical protein